jgi:hypothetical protein
MHHSFLNSVPVHQNFLISLLDFTAPNPNCMLFPWELNTLLTIFHLISIFDTMTVHFFNNVLVLQEFHVLFSTLDVFVVSPNAMLISQYIHFLIIEFHMIIFLSNKLLIHLQFP